MHQQSEREPCCRWCLIYIRGRRRAIGRGEWIKRLLSEWFLEIGKILFVLSLSLSLFRLSRFTGNADSILGGWNWSCGGRCRLVHRGSVDDAIQPFPLRKSLIYWVLTIIQLFANVILWLLTFRHPWSATQLALRVLDGVGLISPLLKLVFPFSLFVHRTLNSSKLILENT